MLGTAPRRATPDSYTAMSAGGLYTTTKPKKHARVATEARGLDVAPLHDRPTKPSLSSRRPLFSKPLAVAIPPEEGPSHPSRHEPCPDPPSHTPYLGPYTDPNHRTTLCPATDSRSPLPGPHAIRHIDLDPMERDAADVRVVAHD